MHGEELDTSFLVELGDPTEVVTMCSMCSTGLALVTRSDDSAYTVYIVPDFHKAHAVRVTNTCLAPRAAPSCVYTLERYYSFSGEMEVMLGTRDNSIVILSNDGNAEDQMLDVSGSAAAAAVAVAAHSPHPTPTPTPTTVTTGRPPHHPHHDRRVPQRRNVRGVW